MPCAQDRSHKTSCEEQMVCIDPIFPTNFLNAHSIPIDTAKRPKIPKFWTPLEPLEYYLTSSRVRVILISERAVGLLASMATSIHLDSHSSQAISRRQSQGAAFGIGFSTEVDALIAIGDAVGVRCPGRVLNVLKQYPSLVYGSRLCFEQAVRTHKMVASFGTSSNELISGAVISKSGTA